MIYQPIVRTAKIYCHIRCRLTAGVTDGRERNFTTTVTGTRQLRGTAGVVSVRVLRLILLKKDFIIRPLGVNHNLSKQFQ